MRRPAGKKSGQKRVSFKEIEGKIPAYRGSHGNPWDIGGVKFPSIFSEPQKKILQNGKDFKSNRK